MVTPELDLLGDPFKVTKNYKTLSETQLFQYSLFEVVEALLCFPAFYGLGVK